MRASRLTRLVILTLGLLIAPVAAGAQPAARSSRVGVLLTGQMRPELARLIETLRAGLRDHGYVEGRNLTLDIRAAEGQMDRLPALAAELIGLPVDVLAVSTMQAALAAKAATRTTPVVFIAIADPVDPGLVASLARPGGNLTGLTWIAAPEQCAKWLELIKEAVPGVSRVAALQDPDPIHPACLAARDSATRQLNLVYHRLTVRQPEDLPGAFAAIERAQVHALYHCVSMREEPVLDFVARRRLPSVACWRQAVAAGSLMSYSPSIEDQWRRAAVYIDKILKGARPADLPVEQPIKFELVINLRTAKALGLTIPQPFLLRADEIIE